MKHTFVLIALLIVACSNKKSPNNPVQGKWKIYGVDIHSPNANENADILKQQIKTLPPWDFRKDNSFENGEEYFSKATYRVSANELYITTKKRVDTFSYSVSNDTMYITNEKALFSYTMQFKKLK